MSTELTALIQVLLIDLTLAGDNAVIVGLAVAGLPAAQRGRAVVIGIAMATVIRIAFSLIALQLLAVIGLTLAGGLLLLWVCYKMYRELRHPVVIGDTGAPSKTLRQAIFQITLADISMSLDNVLAVAGAAREHQRVLILGLVLSVVLMAVASSLVARLLTRFRGLAWAGFAMVLYVAVHMIITGGHEVARHVGVG